jgi:hypothetical protein
MKSAGELVREEVGERIERMRGLVEARRHPAWGRTLWDRQRRRIYHRVQTCLLRWESQGYMVRWVMLSSSAESNPKCLAANHARLLRRIGREFGYPGVEYIVIETAEGENVPEEHRGVLHALWAWKVPPGWRGKHFYIPQAWLSRVWEELHGASYVWIAAYRPGHRSRGRVSRYVVSQYLGDQNALRRFFWSWRRTFGVPIVAIWRRFVSAYGSGGLGAILEPWQALVRGEAVAMPGGEVVRLLGKAYA